MRQSKIKAQQPGKKQRTDDQASLENSDKPEFVP
jgi:hypothetical protein